MQIAGVRSEVQQLENILMSKSKAANRVIVGIGVTFAAVVVTVILVAIAALLIFGKDAPPPDVSDLAVVRHGISEDENAYTRFAEACAALAWPDGTYSAIEEGLDAGQWKTNAIASLLSSNETAIAHVMEGLKHERCEVPEITSFDVPLHYVSEYRNLARLMVLKARKQYREGDQAEAFETALAAIRFGHLVEDCGGGLIHYLVGMAIKTIGLQVVEDLLADCSLPPDTLRDQAHQLAAYGPNVKGLQNTFRAEYVLSCSAIDQVAGGNATLGELTGQGTSRLPVRALPYVFQPNRTKARFADLYRPLIAAASKHYSDIGIEELEKEAMLSRPAFLKPNAVGEILVRLLVPAVTAVFERKAREETQVSAVRLMLLLSAHEQAEGSLPASLEELVPAHLDKVPDDRTTASPCATPANGASSTH